MPPVLTRILEPKDKIDWFLVKNILLVVQDKQTFALVRSWGHSKFNKEKVDEEYFEKMLSVVKSLLKANHHRRSYIKLASKLKEQLLKESLNIKSNIDLIYEKPDLISEVDSCLTHIKASLDSLAKSLNPIYGLKLNGWHKKKYRNKEISGLNVVNAINNLSQGGYGDSRKLARFIEDNVGYISYIVSLRDAPIHKGEISTIRGFKFCVRNQTIENPVIFHSEGKSESLSAFLTNTMWNFINFTQFFMVLSLSNLIKGTFLVVDKEEKPRWVLKFKSG